MSTTHLEKIVEDLSKLTVLEMSELKKMLEEKWDVKAAAAAVAVAAGPAAPVAAAVEATEFEVTLLSLSGDDKKIGVIKEIRAITNLGLKEAKDLVEGAPKVVKPSTTKADAEDIKKKLEAAGAKVGLKGLN